MSKLSVSQLKKARSCERYASLASLNLSVTPDAESEKRSAMKAELIACLKEPTKTKALVRWERFMDVQYPLLPAVISREAGHTVSEKVLRFIEWFFEQGFSIEKTSVPWVFDLERTAITGCTDILARKEDGYIAVEIMFGENPYSDRARNPVNHTDNSLELLCMMYAHREIQADAMCCYLTSKDDRADKLVQDFEVKPGKNVARSAYSDDLYEHIVSVMGFKTGCDCTECMVKGMCKAKKYEPEHTELPAAIRKGSTMKPTEKQQEVIDFRDGPLAVVAVPGAGKTQSLVDRVVTMISEGIRASSIVFVTFTRKACAEISERVSSRIEAETLPLVFTFHSLAHAIIKEQGGMDEAMHLATTLGRLTLIEKAVKNCPVIKGMSYEYPSMKRGLYHNLDAIFKAMKKIGTEAYLRTYEGDKEGVKRVYDEYLRLYREEGYYDYDDLIPKAMEYLKDPVVLYEYQSRWNYFMADEFQDVSSDQVELLYLLSGKSNNIVVVGDDDQSIYKWRDGSSEHMLRFGETHPGAKFIYMEDNFRSGGKILSAADSLIKKNQGRFVKELKAQRGEGLPVYFADVFNDTTLVSFIRSQAEKWRDSMCILARKNSTLERLYLTLTENGIPCNPPRLFLKDSPVFTMLLAVFTIYARGEGTDEDLLFELLTILGENFEPKPGLYARYFGDNAPEKVKDALDAIRAGGDMESLVSSVYVKLTGGSPTDSVIQQMLDTLDEEGVETPYQFLYMLEGMRRCGDDTEIEVEPKAGVINLLTCHKAKGKEFDFVIIYEVESFTEDEQERNLLYVSMTRAKKALVLLKCAIKPAPLCDEIEGMVNLRKGA